jgi:hypothetical protein
VQGANFRLAPNSSWSRTIVLEGSLSRDGHKTSVTLSVHPASIFAIPWFRALVADSERALREILHVEE